MYNISKQKRCNAFVKNKGGISIMGNTIKLQNNNDKTQELTFTSWQQVGQHFTQKDTPVSSATARSIVERNGWQVISVEKVSSPKNKVNYVASLIKQLTTIDKDKLKELTTQRNEISKNVKTSKDAQKLIDINKQIELVSNPQIDKTYFLDQVSKMYDDFMTTENENEKA